MSAYEVAQIGMVGLGAALGAGFASTGRVLPYSEQPKPWPYLTILALGLLLMGFEKTQWIGIGMTAYGGAKSLLRLASALYQ